MAHIWKTVGYFFPLLYICLLCDEVLLPWNFRSPGFDVRAPQDPPKYEKKYYIVHILGLNLKISYQIASLFHMYIYMGERIAGKQDRSSLIIEDPLRAPKIPPKYPENIHFFYSLAHKWKTGFQIVSPCCTYVSTVMRSVFADMLVPLVPLDFMYGPNMTPKIIQFILFFSYFLF